MATTVLGLKTFTASDPVDYNEINDNYNKIDNGVKTALQGRAAHNLLDNSDFTNPVNQRGATSYTKAGYTIDRWELSANTLNVGSDGITLVADGSSSAVLTQYISGLRDGTYTQALNVNGTIYTRIIQLSGSTITTIDGSNAAYTGGYVSCVVSSSGYFSFLIRANAGYSITVRWAALYEGSYTADTLPAYQPKGYAAELAECQRYYVHCGEASWMTGLFKVGEGLIVEIPTANNIRTPNPTIIVNSPKVFTTNGWYDITYASCTVTKCWTKLLFNFPEAASQFMSYYGAYIITGIVGVSADL